jgi:hypothetical protein
VLLLACAQVGGGTNPAASVPAPARGPESPAAPGPLYSLFHRPLKSPEGAIEVLRLHGKGDQTFRCEERSGALHWAYRLPEAELRDDDGKVAVHHGANQTFEHLDGSRLVGDVVDHVPAPTDNTLPWLLIKTRSFGKGALSGVAYVQRIDTVGGMPPESCDASQANQLLRVAFSADFVFFR